MKFNCNSASYWSGAEKSREIARGKSSSGLQKIRRVAMVINETHMGRVFITSRNIEQYMGRHVTSPLLTNNLQNCN